mmetsp:Transcript_8873/g.14029  ORF Transcript_8873/g.14029 Transcript_8873/m.14029 type:complete len:233 (+) Transcript_8873:204-902(+)
MEAVSLEDITAVKHPVVINDQDVPLLHSHCLDVLGAHLVDVVDILCRDLGEIAEVNVSHAHLRHGAGPTVPQVPGVVMDVAEPERLASLRVPVDRRLGVLDGLEASWLAVSSVDHVQIHVKLGRDCGAHQALEAIHEGLLEGSHAGEEVQIQVGNRDADLAVVDVLEDIGLEVPEDLGTVGDEELSAGNGGRVEAHESSVGGSLPEGRLVMQADVVLGQGLLVHLLVNSILG